MTKIEKPVFTPDELDEVKTGMTVGYKPGFLVRGNDFSELSKNRFAKAIANTKELINGTARKRRNHEEINKFGFATFYTGTNEIWFGVRFNAAPNGLSRLAKSALNKYEQLLEYYLRDTGWADIKRDKFSGNLIVPLNNPVNIEMLRTLSPSIGFYYKGPRPDDEDIKRAESAVRYKNRKNRIEAAAEKRKSR